jgi:hypothetical protein
LCADEVCKNAVHCAKEGVGTVAHLCHEGAMVELASHTGRKDFGTERVDYERGDWRRRHPGDQTRGVLLFRSQQVVRRGERLGDPTQRTCRYGVADRLHRLVDRSARPLLAAEVQERARRHFPGAEKTVQDLECQRQVSDPFGDPVPLDLLERSPLGFCRQQLDSRRGVQRFDGNGDHATTRA